MRFFNFVAISSLFATSLAAPATQGEVSIVKARDVPAVELNVVEARTAQIVCGKLQTSLIDVRKHTSAINATVTGVCRSCVAQQKANIIKSVKGEVTLIVGVIHSLTGEVCGLLSGSVEILAEEKQQIISLVFELIFELLCTLKRVLALLGCNVFELLGPLIFTLLTVVGHLLCTLNVLVDGLLKLVFGLLGGVIGLLLEVLKGLLPTVLGICGGVLGKLNLSSLLCGFLGSIF
ncbi:uncharacterized protein CTRU02_200761 [Colletotrichum truncatum]|uniref:Uncharacterized protein n=1 Tax=Colletotrichum truncatum TaxID=5467 RepID=A0ACC3ZFH3_COLTU|nr:uncharacterized protein CTRU02_00528 [Colletotrichum truncatum]KAF6801779.1 hypothetical protein CTRU02_00528 [Colletotrichum truncatum]